MEAVRKGTLAVGVCGKESVVLAVEKNTFAKLQSQQTLRKVQKIDEHICVAFAGLTADARILINRARLEAQSHKLKLEDMASVEYIAQYIGSVQQKYTQSGGVRPFALSTLVAGISQEGPKLYQTDPSGSFSEWKSNAIGRNSKAVRDWLEKYYTNTSGIHTIELALRALSQIMDLSSERIEVAIVDKEGLRVMPSDEVDEIVLTMDDENKP